MQKLMSLLSWVFQVEAILIRLPFFVFFATFTTGNDDGKIVFLAQFITQFTDAVVGLFTVMVFVMFDVVSSTKNDVVVDVTFINMGGDNIRIFSLLKLCRQALFQCGELPQS